MSCDSENKAREISGLMNKAYEEGFNNGYDSGYSESYLEHN